MNVPGAGLREVMWEIAEHNERHDLISATDLQRRVEKMGRYGAFAGRHDDQILARRALIEVLHEIDDLVAEGR